MKSSYQDLKVWGKSMELVEIVYQLTMDLPHEEIYGLTSQMRRCAVSIPSNIAEGSQRGSNKDFSYFLRVARGSSAELQTQLLIADRLGYIKNDLVFTKSRNLLTEVRKMLSGLHASL